MIRAARLDDAAAIAAMSGQLGYPATPEQIRGRLEVVLNREDMGVFVAEEDGVVVGWIHLFGCERIESERSAEIGGWWSQMVTAERASARSSSRPVSAGRRGGTTASSACAATSFASRRTASISVRDTSPSSVRRCF